VTDGYSLSSTNSKIIYSCKSLDCAELIVTFQVTSLLWLVNLKPAVEEAVAVEGVGVGVDSPIEMSQDHYLARVVKLGPVRTSKEMCLPSDLATKEKMVTCYAHTRSCRKKHRN
jgi:hypothetical protein